MESIKGVIAILQGLATDICLVRMSHELFTVLAP